MHQKLRWIERANWITTRLPGLLDYFLLSHFIIALAISGHDSALHVRPCNESIKACPRPSTFRSAGTLRSPQAPSGASFRGTSPSSCVRWTSGRHVLSSINLVHARRYNQSDARTKKADGIGAMGTCNQLNQIDTCDRPDFRDLRHDPLRPTISDSRATDFFTV